MDGGERTAETNAALFLHSYLPEVMRLVHAEDSDTCRFALACLFHFAMLGTSTCAIVRARARTARHASSLDPDDNDGGGGTNRG